MIPAFGYRIAIYLAAILIGGLVLMALEYRASLKSLEHDPSAMAVWGFIVFIWPIFFIVELGLFFWSLTFRS